MLRLILSSASWEIVQSRLHSIAAMLGVVLRFQK